MYLHILTYEIILAKVILTASISPSTEKVIFGGSIVLNCLVSDNVTSKSWARPSKNNTELHNGKIFNKKAANVDKFKIDNKHNAYNLVITNISKEEEGLFCCERVINHNNVTQICTIVEIVGLIALIGKQTLRESEKLRLETSFYSKPPPTFIFWFQNDKIIEDNITLSTSLSKTKTNVTFNKRQLMVFRYKADIVILQPEFDKDVNFSCQIRNSVGNEVVSFSKGEIHDALQMTINEPHKMRCQNISNDRYMYSRTTTILVASFGGSVVVINILIFGIFVVKKSNTGGSSTVITVNNLEEEEQVGTTALDHDHASEGISLTENSYQEVAEIEHPRISTATSNDSSSSSELISDGPYLDMAPHHYEDIDQSNTELHEYLSCDYNLT